MTLRASRNVTYILPISSEQSKVDDDLAAYLGWLADRVETIVVDGSPPPVFAAHTRAWRSAIDGGLVHVPTEPDLTTAMGKVGGVLTGVRLASHERLIIADDDVRYDTGTLQRVAGALDHAEVVRPQNYFSPLPWHARWDTGRMLLNRVTGGDWPGTLAVRRSVLRATDGYDGRAMFENLELVRTVRAVGGREVVLGDAFTLRRPPTARHFWSQRVRQAYDEMARPERLLVQLAVLPLALALALTGHWLALALGAVAVVVLAEAGRWHDDGRSVFPISTSVFAPIWLAERSVCVWLAVGARMVYGGVRYRGTILSHAATPMPVLRGRHARVRRESAATRATGSRRQSA